MPVSMPPTSASYGKISLLILDAEPANPAAITTAEATAGTNITCHMVGDWLPTATTEKVARQRKMCQTQTTNALGATTHDTPALIYTYNPQSVGTPAAAGNEAYEALPGGTTKWAVQRLGPSGTADFAAADKYRLFPLDLGPQVPGVSADDAGGEFVINQEVAFSEGFTEPVFGIVAA